MNRTFKIMMMSTFSGALMASCSSQKIQYPDAPTDETVVDEYFGTKVPDKFRPLENDTAPATLEWVKAENAVTEEYLSKIPFRDKIKERLLELNNYKKTGFCLLYTSLEKIRKLNAIAENRGQTLAEMSLAWLLAKKGLTSVIIGASSVRQLEDNIKTTQNIEFSEEELNLIEETLR